MKSSNGKISTSIQYQLTNVKMLKEVFEDWKKFNNLLIQGPNVVKEHLLQEWNELKEQLKNNEKIFI